MKINHRHYILIVFALISITVLVYGYVFIYKKTLQKTYSYESIVQEVNSEDNRKSYEQELLSLYESSKVDRLKISSFIIHNDKIVNFIETVEKIGDDTNTGFELSSINNDTDTIKAKISAKGSWINVMKALVLIENLPFNVSISNVYLNTSGGLDNSALKVSDKRSIDTITWNLSLDIKAITTK